MDGAGGLRNETRKCAVDLQWNFGTLEGEIKAKAVRNMRSSIEQGCLTKALVAHLGNCFGAF